MIDYRLHVFRQVAEVRSLTKASKALHLSQPAVSKHIKLLEEELHLPSLSAPARALCYLSDVLVGFKAKHAAVALLVFLLPPIISGAAWGVWFIAPWCCW
jgi:hypothetical protein